MERQTMDTNVFLAFKFTLILFLSFEIVQKSNIVSTSFCPPKNKTLLYAIACLRGKKSTFTFYFCLSKLENF